MRKQANRKRIDVEIHVGNVKIAREAEQGQNSTKEKEAIGDTDGRLRQRNADFAIAACYPDGITARSQLELQSVQVELQSVQELQAKREPRRTS